MQNLQRIKQNFKNLSDSKFSELGNNVIAGLTKNSFFPNVKPKLDLFKNPFYEYLETVVPRSERSSANARKKKIKKEAAIRQLLRLAFYVEYAADFNVEALQSSNFELVGKRQTKGPVGTVKKVTLHTNGQPGIVIAKCEADPNAVKYHARVSTDEKTWRWGGRDSSRTVEVHSLPHGVRLFVQMRMENSHGFSPWSTAVIGKIGDPDVIPSIHG